MEKTMNGEKVQIPAAPSLPGFDAERQARWRSDWAKAFKQAQVDHPGDEITQRAVATREANRVLRVEEPSSYEEAIALEDFRVLYRGNAPNGKFCVVTIDGKKYYFDVREVRAPETAAEKDGGKKSDAKKSDAGAAKP
jgi:hypothetical protein